MNTYFAYFKTERVEVQAKTVLDALLTDADALKTDASKVAVILVKYRGKTVPHRTPP